jgi:hypothetical protein
VTQRTAFLMAVLCAFCGMLGGLVGALVVLAIQPDRAPLIVPPPSVAPADCAPCPAPEVPTEGPGFTLPRPVEAEIRGAQTFLRVIGADWHDPYMTKAVIAWFRQESGGVSRTIGNNPLNVRGGTGYAVYPTLNLGFEAAANNLLRLAPRYGYGTVLEAARGGNALAFLGAVARSAWCASHYGVRTREQARTPVNHLVAVYSLLPMPERRGLREVP